MQRLTVLLLAAAVALCTADVASAQARNRGERQPIRFDPNKTLGQLGGANQYLQWRRNNQLKFQSALRAQNPNNAEKAELLLAAEVYVNRMTDPDNRESIPKIADELLTRVGTFGSNKSKDVILPELTDRLSQLLTHEQNVVRVNAAVFLGRLDQQAPGLGGNPKPAVPFWPVYLPLLDVLEDPNQTLDVKYAAARSLRRVAQSGALPRQNRDDVIFRLEKVLSAAADPANWPENPDQLAGYWVYPKVLVEVMGGVKEARTLTVQPIPVSSLLAITIDERQHWWTRATAYHLVSELPLDDDPAFDIGVLASLGVRLAQDAASDYGKDPNASHWRWTFTLIYLAFRPLTPELADQGYGWEAMAEMTKFRSSGPTVTDGFLAIVPAVQEVLGANPVAPKPLSNKALAALDAFVEANPVDGKKAHPRSPAITFIKPAPAPAPAADNPAATSIGTESRVANRPDGQN